MDCCAPGTVLAKRHKTTLEGKTCQGLAIPDSIDDPVVEMGVVQGLTTKSAVAFDSRTKSWPPGEGTKEEQQDQVSTPGVLEK